MRLKYINFDLKRRSRTDYLLLVRFKDERGQEYDWAPEWGKMDKLYAACYLTEVLNGGKELGFLTMVDKLRGDKSLKEAIEKAEEQIDLNVLAEYLEKEGLVVVDPSNYYDYDMDE